MKYAAVVGVLVLAFGLHYAAASWVGFVHQTVTAHDSAGFATPQGWRKCCRTGPLLCFPSLFFL